MQITDRQDMLVRVGSITNQTRRRPSLMVACCIYATRHISVQLRGALGTVPLLHCWKLGRRMPFHVARKGSNPRAIHWHAMQPCYLILQSVLQQRGPSSRHVHHICQSGCSSQHSAHGRCSSGQCLIWYSGANLECNATCTHGRLLFLSVTTTPFPGPFRPL